MGMVITAIAIAAFRHALEAPVDPWLGCGCLGAAAFLFEA